MRWKNWGLGLLLGVALLQPAVAKEWPVSDPARQGLDVTVLDELDRDFASGKYGDVDGMLVVRHGFVVYEKNYPHDYSGYFTGAGGPYNYSDPQWHPYHGEGLHSLQSVTKSVTSALIGIAIQRGELSAEDPLVAPYFGDHPQWAGMRLSHLLTMRSGIAWDEDSAYEDPKNDWAGMERSRDWLGYVLARPMESRPGEKFYYNSGVTILLARILQLACGQEADDYAGEVLFRPLGIERWFWKRSPTGLPDTQGGLYLTLGDLARFGQLYLQDGVWEGRRILPVGWVKRSMTPVSEEDGWKYGYHWWLLPYGDSSKYAYACLGYGGQRLLVVPELDLVAVLTGWNLHGKPTLGADQALQRVVQSVVVATPVSRTFLRRNSDPTS